METTTAQFVTDLSENQVIIRDTIRDFTEKNIRPYIMKFDESQEFPRKYCISLVNWVFSEYWFLKNTEEPV